MVEDMASEMLLESSTMKLVQVVVPAQSDA